MNKTLSIKNEIIKNDAYANLSHFDIMEFIMRKENYIIGLIEKKVLKIGIPFLYV